MSTSLLEEARAMHADIESLERDCVERLVKKKRTNRQAVRCDQRVAQRVEQIKMLNKALLKSYERKDPRRKELQSMRGEGMELYRMFYGRLGDLREYHLQYDNDLVNKEVPRLPVKTDDEIGAGFTAEERHGKHLDMHAIHLEFLNIPDMPQLDYVTWLESLSAMEDIPLKLKTPPYQKYLERLLEYLVDFLHRARPLLDTELLISEAEKDFVGMWDRGEVPGWPKEANGSAEFRCDVCDKTFAKQVSYQGHLQGKKHLRALKRAAQQIGRTKRSRTVGSFQRETALIETKVLRLFVALSDQLHDTRQFVQQKQASTYEELQLTLEREKYEEEEAEAAKTSESEEESEEEDTGEVYNPHNVPLDWDGKPIPYWLFKARGLNHYFDCEICGNQRYQGREAFEAHFTEWRHSHCMKLLGIPNTKHFREITKIADARALYKKLKEQTKFEGWNPEVGEEVEDEEGNVYSLKTYSLLKKQGLV